MNIKQSSTKKKVFKRLHDGRVTSLILLLIISVFILYPVIMIVVTSFNQNGFFSFRGYVKTFSSSTTYNALINTIKMVTGVLIGTWIIGGSFAYIRHKTDYKRKRMMDTFVFLSFTIPAYILSISWIEFVSRGGYLNRLFDMIFPMMRYNINAYTIGATSVILALHLYPLVYYGAGNALKLLGDSFEQSAKVCGAKEPRVIFKVILPLIAPAFISTGLLVVSRSMANFGVPAQIALPTGAEVLTTRVFSAMADLDLSVVAVLSLLLILLSVTMFLFSQSTLKSRHYDFGAVQQNTVLTQTKLGRRRTFVDIFIYLFFVISIVIPFLTIIVSSFFKRWGLSFSLNNLTLGNYKKLFFEENLLTKPLINSLYFGIIAATIASIIASLIVYFYKYKKDGVSKWLINIAQLPIAIPNMILAVAAMFAWINEPFKLYGTAAIIIITYIVLFTPICIKQILGSSETLDRSMDDAAKTMNIPLFQRFFHLFIPQIKDSLLAGFLICFLISLKEIPISLLLYTSATKTLGIMMFTIQSNSYGLEMTSAISVVVIALSVIGNSILRKLGSRGYKA